jgi:hypothetical protein
MRKKSHFQIINCSLIVYNRFKSHILARLRYNRWEVKNVIIQKEISKFDRRKR